MAKLIVYAIDLPGDEDLKRGHVVDILNDEDDPGSEITNGALMPDGSRQFLWRVVKVPGKKEEHAALLERDRKDDDVLKIVPARRHKIDIDVIEAAALVKGGKLESKDEIAVTKAEVDAVVSVELVRDSDVDLPPLVGGLA